MRSTEAKLEAEKRAAAEAARAEADRRSAEAARVEAERKEKVATAKSGGPASAAAAPQAGSARAGGTAKFDGAYNGTICNFPKNPERRLCFNSSFKLANGAADWSWLSRVTGKRASARLTVAGDANVAIDLDGWNINDGSPLAGVMKGRASDNGIDAQGRWANGAPVEAHWARAQ